MLEFVSAISREKHISPELLLRLTQENKNQRKEEETIRDLAELVVQ